MPAVLVVCVGVVQVLGLAALAWARMSEGAAHSKLAQIFFFVMLAIVAAMTAINVTFGNALWPVCAVTFGVMTVAATISSRRELEAVV